MMPYVGRCPLGRGQSRVERILPSLLAFWRASNQHLAPAKRGGLGFPR